MNILFKATLRKTTGIFLKRLGSIYGQEIKENVVMFAQEQKINVVQNIFCK